MERLIFLLFPFELLYIFIYALFIYLRDIFRAIIPGAPLLPLKGEIILVTGGANGIGRAICHQLVTREKNLTIIIWDVNEKAISETISELKLLGVLNAFSFVVDVSNREQVTGAAEKNTLRNQVHLSDLVLLILSWGLIPQIRKDIGEVSILFNNAGISGNLNEGWLVDPKVIEKVIAVNMTSHFWTLREFLPKMIEKGRGHVVETCSMLGIIPSPSNAAYSASKFGIRGCIESIKQDLRLLPSKPEITFTMVYPSVTLTDMTKKLDFSHMRYRFMFNAATPKYVAEKMIDAVVHRQEHLFINWIDRLIVFLDYVLPSEASNKLMNLAGVTSFHLKLMES